MKEEGISSSCDPVLAPRSPTPTPAASSVGASSPAFPVNVESTDGLGQGQGSKGGYLSRIALSSSADGSALGSSQPSCRPWERGDLLRRLSTFTPPNWSGKPKTASSLACARKGWVNVAADKIRCESCGANLEILSSAMWTPTDANSAAEEFSRNLDEGHKGTCPWRGNSCAESLVQFPPTPPSALVGGFKDRCDGLTQFDSLPIVAASAIEQMRVSHGTEIDRFIAQSLALAGGVSGLRSEVMCGTDNIREDMLFAYTHAQKLISLCGWEPRWLPNVQDYEENSAQSARNGGSVGPSNFRPPKDLDLGKKVLSANNNKIELPRYHGQGLSCNGESRSPLLDCSLCGATVRIWDFRTVDRPPCFAANNVDIPETSKKMGLTRGASAASGISGWVATDGTDKEQIKDLDEAATGGGGKSVSNVDIDLNLTVGGASTTNKMSEQNQDVFRGKGVVIRQPSSSEVGDHAASYESRGPSSRKRNLDQGGSTVDIPPSLMQQADSTEGTVIDRDGDEVNDFRQYSAGPSKRVRGAEGFESHRSLHGTDSYGAGPSQRLRYEMGTYVQTDEVFDQGLGVPSARDSTHVSSVIAMDTICHTGDEDSMESVENYPGNMEDVDFPSTSNYKCTDPNETSELNYSAQAQQSTCPAAVGNTGELGVSSTNDEEVLNADTATAHGKDAPSFGISGGSVGMGASHEAEIHGIDAPVHRAENDVDDVEPITEITENQGQTGEYVSDPGLMGDYVPEEMDSEDPHGDSQDVMSPSVGRTDSGSKIIGLAKAESVESGDKTSIVQPPPPENDLHPSMSCNAIVCSGFEASKEEVTQAKRGVPADESGYVESGYRAANGTGPSNGESNYDNAVQFDPIKQHNNFCPWVNGNVAAAGCTSNSGSSPSAVAVALSGWQLTLDALDAQSLGNVPVQPVESESAASLNKDDHHTTSRKLLAHHSFNKSRGPS